MSTDNVHRSIIRYHQGLMEADPAVVLTALGNEFIMFNGNYSAEPTNWQAHMYLSGKTLQEWPAVFLKEAGPYKNKYEFLHTHIRGDAAVVVTRETGQNRFRSWENEIVTWLLGQRDEEWRIAGYFIRDLSNPE